MSLVDVHLSFDQGQKYVCHEVLPRQVLYVRLDKQVKQLGSMQIRFSYTCCPASSVVEHETLNLRVVGSSPTLGAFIFLFSELYASFNMFPLSVY